MLVGVVGAIFGFLVQTATVVFSLAMNVIQAYFMYFNFIIDITRKNR